MKCSVYIAASVDGMIARKNGAVDWLHTAGKQDADLGDNPDMGFSEFLASVDCIIMGRKCMEAIASMKLTDAQWPYGNIRMIVLSNTLTTPPSGMEHRIELYSGELLALVKQLEHEGLKRAYIDGGTTIQNFINLKLINDICITQVPMLIGEGIPLFGKTFQDITLTDPTAQVFANDYVQMTYQVDYTHTS